MVKWGVREFSLQKLRRCNKVFKIWQVRHYNHLVKTRVFTRFMGNFRIFHCTPSNNAEEFNNSLLYTSKNQPHAPKHHNSKNHWDLENLSKLRNAKKSPPFLAFTRKQNFYKQIRWLLKMLSRHLRLNILWKI